MYTPTHYRIDDQAVLFDFMSKNNFGILISIDHATPIATHLPFLIDSNRGEHGILTGHVAKANMQWRTFTPDREVLIIFQGPHTYISPSWYQEHPSVPTWNYATVHVNGLPRIVVDGRARHDILQNLVNKHEAAFEKPWQMNLPEDYYQQQVKMIVVFEIEVTRLEGKFKMSQNRSDEDRSSVVAALNQLGDDNSIEVARFII